MTDNPDQPAPPPPPGPPEPAARPGFSVDQAAFHMFHHASRTGWSGLAALAAAYVALMLLLYVAAIALVAPVFVQLMEYAAAAEADPDAIVDPREMFGAFGMASVGYGLLMLGSFAVYHVNEAALQRWYFGRGVRVRLGGDEVRLIVVSILWLLMGLAATLVPTVLLALGAATENALLVLLGVLSVFAAIVGWIYLCVRIAPAAALTVYSGQIRFASAWPVTRGAFWAMLGAFVIVIAIYIGISLVLQTALQPFMFLALGDQMAMFMDPAASPDSPEAFEDFMRALFLSPAMITVWFFYGLLALLGGFAYQALLAGVNAYRVKFVHGVG